jgi:hypothetical protein
LEAVPMSKFIELNFAPTSIKPYMSIAQVPPLTPTKFVRIFYKSCEYRVREEAVTSKFI